MSKVVNSKKDQLLKKYLKFPLIIIVLLVITNIATLLYYQPKLENPIANYQNPYPYIDLSRNFIAQENFIVNLQPLRESLDSIYKEYGADKMALYVEFLNSGANISYNQDARYYPASLIKTPVAIAAVKRIQDGYWNWDSKLVIFEEDVDTKFGKIGNMPIGTRLTIEELLTEVLTKSDNTAYKMLLRNLGAGPVNDFLTETGLIEFFDQDLNITAKEYTRLFRSLYTSSYLKREYSQKFLQLLSTSERNYLGQAIPGDIIYAHKFGENVTEKIFADSGIVYIPNRPYIITVLYHGGGEDDKITTDKFFYEISDTVFKFFSQYKK